MLCAGSLSGEKVSLAGNRMLGDVHEVFRETVDIHAGGIDHITVHHENEIAQSGGTRQTIRPLLVP